MQLSRRRGRNNEARYDFFTRTLRRLQLAKVSTGVGVTIAVAVLVYKVAHQTKYPLQP